MKDEKEKRGVTIGSLLSPILANLCVDEICHIFKEVYRVKCLCLNCDDMVMLAKTKSEANFLLRQLDMLSSRQGLIVKHSAVVAPIGRESCKYHCGLHKRKRQRASKREVN
jgi:hypothetical protein